MREDQTVATRRLLFVCVENSNRSQIAEAFARIHGGENIEAYSAGWEPSGEVNQKAIAAMREVGEDLSKHNSNSRDDIAQVEYDVIAKMGYGHACPFVRAKQREKSQSADPIDLLAVGVK